MTVRWPPAPRRAVTDWEARFQASREPQLKGLDTSFVGITASDRMLVVTPRIVDSVVSEIVTGAVMAAAEPQALPPQSSPARRSMKPRAFEGGFLCGAIRFLATGAFDKPHLKDLAPTAHPNVLRRPRSSAATGEPMASRRRRWGALSFRIKLSGLVWSG